MLWWFNFFLASLSCIGALGSIWCFVLVQKRLKGASARSLLQLSTAVDELTYVSESQSGQIRRLTARIGMAAARQVKNEKLEQEPKQLNADEPIAEKVISRAELKEIARARGFKIP
jgi:hypothetical protein